MKNIQTVIKVFPEQIVFHRHFGPAVGGCQDAHRNGDIAGAARLRTFDSSMTRSSLAYVPRRASPKWIAPKVDIVDKI
jgi:hypothetical protein